MNKIYYAITSYHRPECKTLHSLLKIGIPKERIFIFLNDKADYEEYNKSYGDIVKIIYKSGNNAACNRNNALNYFNSGDYIVIMDDDISQYKKYDINGNSKYGKLVNIDSKQLENILYECFKEIEKIESPFFGIYAIDNTMLLKQTLLNQGEYSVNKVFQGGFMGFIVDNETRFDESMMVLDDYDIVLRNIKKGYFILRRNDLLVQKNKMGSNMGGCYDLYKNGEQKRSLLKLKHRYPNMIKIKRDYSGIIARKDL